MAFGSLPWCNECGSEMHYKMATDMYVCRGCGFERPETYEEHRAASARMKHYREYEAKQKKDSEKVIIAPLYLGKK